MAKLRNFAKKYPHSTAKTSRMGRLCRRHFQANSKRKNKRLRNLYWLQLRRATCDGRVVQGERLTNTIKLNSQQRLRKSTHKSTHKTFFLKKHDRKKLQKPVTTTIKIHEQITNYYWGLTSVRKRRKLLTKKKCNPRLNTRPPSAGPMQLNPGPQPTVW